MRFRDMTMTSSARPRRFEGWTEDDRPVRASLWVGWLHVAVGRPGGNPAEFVSGRWHEVFEAPVETAGGGETSWDELEVVLAAVDLDGALSAKEAEASPRDPAWARLVGDVVTHHLSQLSAHFLDLDHAPWPEGTSWLDGTIPFLDYLAGCVGPGLFVVTYPEEGGWTAHIVVEDVPLNARVLWTGVAPRVGGGPLTGGDGRAMFKVSEPTKLRSAVLEDLARL